MGIEAIEIAVTLQKLNGCLFAHARHTGDIVRRVTHQRLHVDELGRGEAVVAFAQFGRAVDIGARAWAAACVEDLHPLVD